MLMKLTPVVNFTNLLAQSPNVPAQGVWCNHFHQQPCISLYQKTQLEFRLNFYTMHLYDQRKSTGTKAAHKMLMTLTLGVDFTNMFMRSYYAQADPKSAKKTVKSPLSFFCLWDLCV